MLYQLVSACVAALLFKGAYAIIGGSSIKDPNPYIVSLQAAGIFGDTHICGGSIIAGRTVFTTAHCVDGSSASSLVVKHGGSDRNNLRYRIQVNKAIIHPDWNPNTIDNDYAILQLLDEVRDSEGFPITEFPTLPTDSAVNGTTLNISGWGKTSASDNTLPVTIEGASVDALDAASCQPKWQDVNAITTSMACAQSTESSFCTADEGGPVTDASGSILYGVLSWGAQNFGERVCVSDTTSRPNVYADTSEKRAWLQANIM